MSLSVNVLTPTGRRQIVKVTPNSSIYQVLSDVCNKQGLILEEHELKHHNRTLTPSDTVRFANLPNNAQLELIRTTLSDEDAVSSVHKKPESAITIALQLASGERCVSNFCASDTLWGILVHWKAKGKKDILDLVDENGLLLEPVCIYMRREICGEAELKNTSLRSLGLTNGKIILRLLHRPLHTEVRQAFVETLNLKQEQQQHILSASHVSETKTRHKCDSLDFTSTIDTTENPSVDVQLNVPSETCDSLRDHSHKEDPCLKNEDLQGQGVSGRVSPMETAVSHSTIGSGMMDNQDFATDDGISDVGRLVYLDDRHSLLYNLDDVSKPLEDEIPEQFFEVTLDDVRLLLADMKRQRREWEDRPLLTSAMREAQLLTRLKNYPKAVIRVNFPDRLVLQGNFKATDKVEKIMDLVRSFLVDGKLEFFLYLTPPKRILDAEERLFEIPLVPAAVVHFGCLTDLDHFLDERVMKKISSPLAVNRDISFENNSCNSAEVDRSDQTMDRISSHPSTSGISSEKLSSERSQEKPNSPKGGVIPKWFSQRKK